MTVDYQRVMTGVQRADYMALADHAAELGVTDLVELGLLIGPYRLLELCYRQDSRFHRRSPFTSPLPSIVEMFSPMRTVGREQAAQALPEVLGTAFGDRSPQNFQPPMSTVVRSQVAAAIPKVVAARKATQTLRITRDVTLTLPEPTSAKAALSDADFAASALRLGVSVPAIKAVARVESGGLSGFDADFRPKILFEAHHFGRHTKHRFDKTHPHLSCTKRQDAKPFYKWAQYSRLFEAMLLDPVAALKSASWGKFQVLGSNHDGWPEPVAFAIAMFESEANHLRAFEAYCTRVNIVRHLKTLNWAGFAAGYNGANYADFNYDTQMSNAYAGYGGR